MKQPSIRLLRHRVAAFALALCLMLSLCPVFTVPAHADSETALDKLVNWGVVRGYPDGGLHPERNLTRAEFVAMVNRAYGYKNTGATPFVDVASGAWYADDIGIAYNAHYFNGISPRQAGPEKTLTREQAMVLLARNMRLDPIAGEVTEFRDGRDFSEWGRGYARAAADVGLVTGYSDGSFRPNNNITRGEMAYMLQRALGTLVNTPGTHTLSDVYGNVTINTPGATLRNSTIAGNLYITGGLDLGEITLDNVRVLGKIVVAGGGESQRGTDSVVLRNVAANSLLVDSIADQFVTLRTEGDTEIRNTELRSDSFIQDRTRPGQGLLNISLESPDPAASFTLSGNLENIINKTPGSTLNVAVGTADTVTIDEAARNSKLNLDINSNVATLNLDTATAVSGIGDVEHLYVNAAGSTTSMLPDVISIRPGLTASIAGQTMDVVQAQETSSEPRLLAGYPRVKNIAPTTASAIFSANKAGKVYWAVSATANGSVDEEGLISPIADNTKAISSGTTDITSSSKETTAALSRLTADGSYYLSAVMVDARDRRSPVKVISFNTPDNTTPAFNSGYPVISRNYYEQVPVNKDNPDVVRNDYRVQVSSMANKNCQIYYALYPAGSTAPTAQQFRVGSLGTTVPGGSGVEDVSKNSLWTKTFNGLEELKAYDLYLCLIDADGSRNSQVRKLTFTTMDGTPPKFQYDSPEITAITVNSLRLRVNLTENSTVYWAVVKAGTEYLKAPPGTEKVLSEAGLPTSMSAQTKENEALFDAYYKRQIENGVNSVRKGSQSVRADTDAIINITGLSPETYYDIYYIAKDAAGNYSEIQLRYDAESGSYRLDSNILTESTLDNTGPTATQEFSLYDNDTKKPYANTDVIITLSENVQRTSRIPAGDPDLLALYKDPNDADRKKLAEFLRNTFELYILSDVGHAQPVSSDTIDYSKAEVEQDVATGKIAIRFKSGTGAINLKSGATYYFRLVDLSDVSSSRNPISGGQIVLPRFTTIAAEVALRTMNVTNLIDADSNSVEIDLAFSLTPTSVNVEDFVDWDVLLWMDTSSTFDVYLMEAVPGGYSGTKITNSEAMNPNGKFQEFYQSVKNKSPNENPNGEIIINESMSGFYGKSLFRDFFGYMSFPSINETLGRLTAEGGSYSFGIHFTAINSELDRRSWGSTVNFRASVVTGNSTYLGTLAADITEDRYADHLQNWNITEIGTPIPFAMRAVFTNTKAPTFVNGYPTFTPLDTSATMNLMLSQSGTVYYVVAPIVNKSLTVGTVSETGAAIKTASDITGVPRSGSDEPSTFLLSEPKPNQIYSPSSFRSNSFIKTGNAAVGNAATPVVLTGLEPNTTYLAYFVTRGTGSIYSPKVYLYQFTTNEARRPALSLTLSNPTVTVSSTNMDAAADFLLIRYDNAMNSLLKENFNDRARDKDIEGWSSSNNSLTVLEALNRNATTLSSDGSTGSLFDQFAAKGFKEQLASYIRATSANSDSVIGNGKLSLRQGVAQGIDCSRYHMSSITQYAFLVVGQSTAAGGSDDAFRAIYPVTLGDNQAPRVQSITHNLSASGTSIKDASASGRITLTFDENLYYLDQSQTPYATKAVDRASLYSIGMKDTRQDYVSIGSSQVLTSTISADSAIVPVFNDNSIGSATLVIELDVKHATNGSNIVFSNRLCDVHSNVRNTGLTISVSITASQVVADYGEDGKPIMVTVYTPTVNVSSGWRAPDMTVNGEVVK
ncbi:MAG: S-layer homology domain-containing protein [Oscillospiraceae bacterium]|nr:S-layer homology domain-containing protein [Oscillospiraceae bacterium]